MTRRSTLPGRAAGTRSPRAAGPAAPPPRLVTLARRLAVATLLAVAVAGLLGVSACGSQSEGDTTTLHVLAAASLREAFTKIGADFQKDHPGVEVTFEFVGRPELLSRLGEAEPGDVIATADTRSLDTLAGKISSPQVFATNTMAIAVAPGNPAGITGLASLADPRLKVVLAAPEVPAGRYAGEILTRAGLTVKPVSLEESVKGVATKVSLGEADAGIVFLTDVLAAADTLGGVDIPPGQNVTAVYPIATLDDTGSRFVADQFVKYVLSATGQQTLQSFGFGPPQGQ